MNLCSLIAVIVVCYTLGTAWYFWLNRGVCPHCGKQRGAA